MTEIKEYLTCDKIGFVAVCFTLSCGKKSFSDPGHIIEFQAGAINYYFKNQKHFSV